MFSELSKIVTFLLKKKTSTKIFLGDKIFFCPKLILWNSEPFYENLFVAVITWCRVQF